MTQKPGMTVTRAIEELQRILETHRSGEDLCLAVPYESSVETLGARCSTPVAGFNPGFDWDRGKVFVSTEQALGEPVELDKSRRRELYLLRCEVLWNLPRILSQDGLTETQKLKVIEQSLSVVQQKLSPPQKNS